MDLALEAGDKTCARQYSETAEQAGTGCSSSPPTQWRLPRSSWRWRSRTAPRRWRCLERLLRQPGGAWDLSASPLYRHLPTKEATREVQQIMLQYLLEELERDPESAFLRETPGYQEMLERVHRAEI